MTAEERPPQGWLGVLMKDGGKKGKIWETEWEMMMSVALVTAFLLPAVTVSMAIFSMSDGNPPSAAMGALLTNSLPTRGK